MARELEDIQMHCQENQNNIFWWQDSKNHIKKSQILEPNELGLKKKLPAIEVIQYNGRPCIELDDLWQALHQSFNSAHNHQVNTDILDKILSKSVSK